MSAVFEIRQDGVAVITVKNPPVNALSNSVLKSIIRVCEIIDVCYRVSTSFLIYLEKSKRERCCRHR